MAKKKEAHHGGAWKVAFADFMTAMMALFLVLWISAQDKEILIATSQYFQSPFNSPMDNTSGVLPFESNATSRTDDGSGRSNTSAQVDLKALQAMAREFYRLLNVSETDPNAPAQVEVTSDGLKVTLFERTSQPMFVKDSTDFTDWGMLVMQNLSWLIDRQKFRVVVEGHARAGMTSSREGYTEWDLSTDEANATRRALTYYAVDPARFVRVSGFGAMQPMPGEAPDSQRNQRIVLSLSLSSKPSDQREMKLKEPATKPEPATESAPEP